MLKCSDGTYYIGIAQDVEKRILSHNGKLPKGAKYTRSRRPVSLVYKEAVESRAAALRRELELKRLTHLQKKKLHRTLGY